MEGKQSLVHLDLSDTGDDMLVRLGKLDLSQVHQEQLSILLDRFCRVRARQTLTLRYFPRLTRFVDRRARAVGLRWHDREDAQQNAILSVYETIERYDHDRCAHGPDGSFRRLLYRIVRHRFHDAYKHLCREERHYDRSVNVSEVCVANGDPACLAELHEEQVLLQGVLGQLEEPEHRFVDQLADGVSLRVIAHEAAVSYATAKRMRDRLRARLQRAWRQALRGCARIG